MSTQVEINGETFLPIRDAAKLVSYSKDYVARLAREQKIVASQIGRQWFIDTVSLKNFAETSDIELSVRKQQLSRERKREQAIKQEVLEISKSVKAKAKVAKLQAQLVAVFVLGFGLLTGAGIYTTTTLFPSQSSSLARLGGVAPESTLIKVSSTNKDSQSVIEPSVITEARQDDSFAVAQPQATTLFTSVSEYPLFTDEAEIRSLSVKNSEGIFLLARDGDMSNPDVVESLFSDDVEVRYEEGSRGVISYERSTGEVAEFPFVALPVNGVANQGSSTIEQ